jgi:predicted MPP superfamily phosphohydrolase
MTSFFFPDILQVRSFEVGVLHLHPSLHGLKIAQLTDIHFNDRRLIAKGASDAVLQAVVEAVERESVDLVVLTGDYADLWPEDVTVLADRWLSKLTSKHGTVAILGNHDYQRAHSQRTVLEAFQSVGIHTLVNQRAEPINEWLEVMGVGDYWKDYHPEQIMCPLSGPSRTEKDDDHQDKEEAEAEEGVYRRTRLVLTHNPDSSLHLNQWGADLMLAGHTHGGHLRRAWNSIMLDARTTPTSCQSASWATTGSMCRGSETWPSTSDRPSRSTCAEDSTTFPCPRPKSPSSHSCLESRANRSCGRCLP